MKSQYISTIIAVIVLLTACSSQKQKDRTISLSGAFALYPLAVTWAEEYKKIQPEIRFNISGGGAGKGMADALSGAVDLGMFSREISKEEKDKGVWWVGLTIDAVIPTISNQNPYIEILKTRGLTREEFAGIFIKGTIKNWSELINSDDKKTISILTRSDACGAAETWAKYLGGKQENLLGIGIFGDPGLAEAVTKDQLSIGFNNVNYVYDVKSGNKRPGIEIIPIDINENGKIDEDENFYDNIEVLLKAIAEGIYPSPPARELYFVANGKPNKQAVLDFIKWTLTDGQKFIKEAGYVPIEKEKIEQYLTKLN